MNRAGHRPAPSTLPFFQHVFSHASAPSRRSPPHGRASAPSSISSTSARLGRRAALILLIPSNPASAFYNGRKHATIAYTLSDLQHFFVRSEVYVADPRFGEAVMYLTDYHTKYFAHELTKRCPSDSLEKLAGALVDAQVDLNPHQGRSGPLRVQITAA
jgi:hypothetical protein